MLTSLVFIFVCLPRVFKLCACMLRVVIGSLFKELSVFVCSLASF